MRKYSLTNLASGGRSSCSAEKKWQPPSEAEPLCWKSASDSEESEMSVTVRRLGSPGQP